MKYWVVVLVCVAAKTLQAQVITGTVYDQINHSPLPGATVVVSSGEGTVTDENGTYILEDIKPGRSTLRISFLGYESRIISDVWVKTGKVTTQDVILIPGVVGLDEIVVVKEKAQLSLPGRLEITEEQINRYAATYFDPARLVTTSPDVSVSNDQNNQISARGISPAYNVWRLEGAEIINPNHLSNAGNFTDQPTATGGGVNILSAQMLSRSAFLYGAFDNSYSNSVGGIFDMHLKKGNDVKRQFTAQASLIGLDFASDGPVDKSGKITYAVNYRYSFTGLLTHFGVDFGGESIGFQDLALTINLPVNDRNELKIFAVGGTSFNDFEHKSFAESEIAKDRKDIFYENKTGIIGGKLTTQFDAARLSTTLAFSGLKNERKENGYANDDHRQSWSRTGNFEFLTSLHTAYSRKINTNDFTVGGLVNYYNRRLSNIGSQSTFNQDQYLIQPYFMMSDPLTGNVGLTYGLTYSQTLGDFSVDPRAGLTFLLDTKNSLSLNAGWYSQLLNPYNFHFSNPYGKVLLEDQYDLIRSGRLTFGHLYERQGFNFGTEVFAYFFPEVNIGFEEKAAASAGVSVSSEKTFENDFYYRLGGSLFRSSIAGISENQFDHRFNLSMASGKEWALAKKSRTISLNGRLLYQGGQNFTSIKYMNENPLVIIPGYRTSPYFRFDLRVQWTRYHANHTSSLAVDLQNAIGYRNEAYQYYDDFTGEIETQYQLGLIPILTYRVEW